MCSWPETMITSRNGFTGSVTQACRIVVQIGSLTPAMSPICVDQPATQEISVSQPIGPLFVCTPVTRPFRTSTPVTSIPWWISAPPRSAARA